jgi:hypothetical protein
MERSIENTWKQGFLKSDALVAPKINDIYNRKSMHMIEKFEKMFRINIWGIIIGSSLLFVVATLAGALLAGSLMLIMMFYVAYTAYLELKSLEKLDKGQSSYAFLKSFKDWIDRSTERYGNMYRFVYPAMILLFYFGMWFSDIFTPMREKVMESTSDLIFGLHTYTTLVIIICAGAMSVFSKAIHKEDVKTIYGKILDKLDRAIDEMEELQK